MNCQLAETIASPLPTLEKLHALESEIAKLPPVELRTEHTFAKGVYVRQLWIPAGTFLTGKLHKTEHVSICAAGEISVLTPTGMKRVKAPYVVVCPPGTKRAAYAHTDTLWINIHATDERDLDKLETLFIDHEPSVDEANRLQAERYPVLEKAS